MPARWMCSLTRYGRIHGCQGEQKEQISDCSHLGGYRAQCIKEPGVASGYRGEHFANEGAESQCVRLSLWTWKLHRSSGQIVDGEDHIVPSAKAKV